MIKFFAENLVKQSRIYVDSENKLFPKENIFDNRRSKVFRSLTNSAEIIFDLQEKSFVETVILVPPKKGFFGFTSARIQLDEHGDFTVPLIDEAIEVFDVAEIATVTFPKTEARFVKIILNSSLNYCELSKIFIGSESSIGDENGVDNGWIFVNDEIVSISKNALGQIFSDKIARQKKLSFEINTMIEEELNVMTGITDRLGRTEPIFILVNCKEENEIKHRRSGYYRFTDIPDEKNKVYGLYDMSYKLEEYM